MLQSKTFKALALFLCYPSREWQEGLDGLCDVLDEENLLTVEDRAAIRAMAQSFALDDLYGLQERYVDTFDRVRSLSLHLFEHVHGESRERGQAMVDLADVYKEQGFALAPNELPDYLPAFLEFLSLLPTEEALEMLDDPAHVLSALGKRLAERGSPYHAVFDALVRLTGRVPEQVTRKVDVSPPSFEQLDKEWEEKPVEFMGAAAPDAAGGCGGGSGCSSGGCGG